MWVAGEVQRVRRSQRGHLYFELVEKGSGDRVVGKLECVAWRSARRRIERSLSDAGQELADGQQIRCLAEVDFYGPFGRLQLVVREVDAVYALGMLERRRRETLAALEANGLLDRNSGQPLAALPLALALVTSEGSAAYHDFVSSLQASGYGFEVTVLHSAVQGTAAEHELVAALSVAGALPVDAVVVIRGGGARTDLAAFDSRSVAEAIARAPVPVLTGLGHQTDESIADRVAARAFKTPTGAGEFLVGRVRREESRLRSVAEALRRQASLPLVHHRRRLDDATRRLSSARRGVRRQVERLAGLRRALVRRADERLRAGRRALDLETARIAAEAVRSLARQAAAPEALAGRIVPAAQGRLREAAVRLDGWQRLCHELAPERLLARGFSITRGADGGTVVDASTLHPGEIVETTVKSGRFRSRVEPT